jgi:hypothetical protein
MFEIDVKGLAELEGGDSHRLAFEPVANVFDEFRGYEEGKKRPSFCAVTLERNETGRGVVLKIADDGAGFANERDIWTLFGSTAKRGAAGVSGRFNAGDKQLIAVARNASVRSNDIEVEFCDGERTVHRRRGSQLNGVIVSALMPLSLGDMAAVETALRQVQAPDGLSYLVNGLAVKPAEVKATVNVTLPTILLSEGVLRPTTRKTAVRILKCDTPTLFELGIPICSLEDVGFPWSLDVGQKIPVPLSRNSVTPQYLHRLIGSVIEQAAMDGVSLLKEEEQGAAFVKGALDWVREPEALKVAVSDLYGANAVRQSNDPIANAHAAATGAPIVQGRWFTPETRRRLDETNSLPVSSTVFPGSASLTQPSADGKQKCPRCGGVGTI